jgi:trypsin
MRSKSPARLTRGLTRRVKLALVVAALLSAATCAPIAIALKAHRSAHAFAHESIIGGTAAEDGSFPSLAYIVDVEGSYVYQCTGTVVAPNLILTAGHCAEDMRTGVVNKPTGYRVVTGSVDPMTPAQVSTVVGLIVYPGLVRRFDDGDAALLVLATPTTAPAVMLATGSETGRLQAGSLAVMAGWGTTSYEQKLPTERLRSATTVVQGRRWCTVNAPPFFGQNEICAIAPPSYATGACSGDSGGPLLVQRPVQPSSQTPGHPAITPAGGEPIEIGVAVHVYGKCSTRRPSVYTSAAAISPWVHTWIAAYKSSAPPTSSPPPSPAAPLPPPPVPAASALAP